MSVTAVSVWFDQEIPALSMPRSVPMNCVPTQKNARCPFAAPGAPG